MLKLTSSQLFASHNFTLLYSKQIRFQQDLHPNHLHTNFNIFIVINNGIKFLCDCQKTWREFVNTV